MNIFKKCIEDKENKETDFYEQYEVMENKKPNDITNFSIKSERSAITGKQIWKNLQNNNTKNRSKKIIKRNAKNNNELTSLVEINNDFVFDNMHSK